MTPADARKLKCEDRVVWDDGSYVNDKREDVGTVCETGYNAIKVLWDDGTIGLYHFSSGGQEIVHVPLQKKRA